MFGFTIASLMLWLGVAMLPFATQVAAWFRARMLAARGLPPLGRDDAVENMTPGQIMLGSIGAIVIGSVIAWNAGGKIGAELSLLSGSALPMLLAIFVGAAGLAAGIAVVARVLTVRRSNSRRWMAVGITIGVLGVICLIAGVTLIAGAL